MDIFDFIGGLSDGDILSDAKECRLREVLRPLEIAQLERRAAALAVAGEPPPWLVIPHVLRPGPDGRCHGFIYRQWQVDLHKKSTAKSELQRADTAVQVDAAYKRGFSDGIAREQTEKATDERIRNACAKKITSRCICFQCFSHKEFNQSRGD